MIEEDDNAKCCFDFVPNDILYYIFGMCEMEDMARLASVCKRFSKVVQDEHLWKLVAKRKGWEKYELNSKTWKEFCVDQYKRGGVAERMQKVRTEILTAPLPKDVNGRVIVKLVDVGDSLTGKTCSYATFAVGMPLNEVPQHFSQYVAEIVFDNVQVDLAYWDLSGNPDYTRLRPLTYPDTNVFVVAYDITSRASFNNVRHTWLPEITHYCPGVPFLLVGMKLDLRTDNNTLQRLAIEGEAPITAAEGMELAEEVGAAAFIECSALTRENLEETYHLAARIGLSHSCQGRKKRNCIIQ